MKKARPFAEHTPIRRDGRVRIACWPGLCGLLLTLAAPLMPMRLFEHTRHQVSPNGFGMTVTTYVYARMVVLQLSSLCFAAGFCLYVGPRVWPRLRRTLTHGFGPSAVR